MPANTNTNKYYQTCCKANSLPLGFFYLDFVDFIHGKNAIMWITMSVPDTTTLSHVNKHKKNTTTDCIVYLVCNRIVRLSALCSIGSGVKMTLMSGNPYTPTKTMPELPHGLPESHSLTVWNSDIHRRRRELLSPPCCPPCQAQQSAARPWAGPVRTRYTPSVPSSLLKHHRTLCIVL